MLADGSTNGSGNGAVSPPAPAADKAKHSE